MRRRRNADAPSAANAAEIATDVAVPSAADAAETIVAPSSAAESQPDAASATVTDPALAPPPSDSPEGETPKPRRRAAARRKTPAAETGEAGEAAPAVEVTATVETSPAKVAPVETPPTDAPETAVPETPAPKAPRRRRTPVAAATLPIEATAVTPPTPEPVAETIAPPVIVPVVSEETAPPVTQETEAVTPRPGRRRGLTRRPAATTETVAPEVVATLEPVPDVVPDAAPEAVETADGATGEPRTRRNRGGRRRRTDVAATATTEEVVEDAPSPVELPAEEATEPRGRQRGPRLQRTPRGGAATGGVTTVAPFAPAEPLPPQYQPLPDEVLARLPETRVSVRKNVAELTVNGDPKLPLWFFVNTEEAFFGDDPAAREVAQRQIRLAYEAGVRTFSVLTHLPWRTRSGERRFGPLDDALQFVAENAPDALILPRLIFSPPPAWERAHGDQMTQYANGETGDVSFGSRLFWEGEADEALRAAVEHVAQSEGAGRVFGFFLEHGEWFHEKGRGYDVSEANTQAFRAWLRTRYKNSQVALRAAWWDGEVTFDTASIPPALPPLLPGASAPLFFSDREQRYVDFHRYASDVVAGVIVRLGKAVKEASGGRSAVVVSYGYTLELSRAYSGHLSLSTILASPNVDILTGPVSYSGRTPGGSAPLPSPVDSVTLAGKLWVSEDDTKTFLAHGETPDLYNPKVASFEGTWAAYTRNFGMALTRGAGVSWMDSWGMGWLDDRELWQRLGRLHGIADAMATRRRNPRTRPAPEPDVAVIVDERSFFDLRADESVLSHLVAQQRDALLRSGARVGFYLLSDLLKKNFPEGPRLLLFLNAFRLPDALRTVIRERFQGNGRTLAWLYGPGSRETNLAELTDVIGMQLRLQPWGSKIGTQPLPNARSPLADALRGQKLGEEVRTNPSFYVADPKAIPLGEYVANGNTSLAIRKHARWQSVFIGEMALTIPLLRGLYRVAGVPVYTVDDDVATMGECLLSLHSAPGGGTTVYLPEEGVLYDLLSDEVLATDGWGARLSMPPRGTRLLFWGSPAEVTRLGGDPRNGPPGLTTAELLPKPMAFVFENAGSEGRAASGPAMDDSDISPEDEALMQAALAGELPGVPAVEDADTFALEDAAPIVDTPIPAVPAETADATDAAKKKRRRRRRGRGRANEAGDETSGENTDEDTFTEDDDSPSDDASFPEDATPPAVETESPTETVTPPSPEISAPRTRPTLDELLPDSAEVAEGVDLPPIPEELLPLPDAPAVQTVGTAEPTPDAPLDTLPIVPRRRRGPVRRTPRATTEDTAPSDTAPDASPESPTD